MGWNCSGLRDCVGLLYRDAAASGCVRPCGWHSLHQLVSLSFDKSALVLTTDQSSLYKRIGLPSIPPFNYNTSERPTGDGRRPGVSFFGFSSFRGGMSLVGCSEGALEREKDL